MCMYRNTSNLTFLKNTTFLQFQRKRTSISFASVSILISNDNKKKWSKTKAGSIPNNFLPIFLLPSFYKLVLSNFSTSKVFWVGSLLIGMPSIQKLQNRVKPSRHGWSMNPGVSLRGFHHNNSVVNILQLTRLFLWKNS